VNRTMTNELAAFQGCTESRMHTAQRGLILVLLSLASIYAIGVAQVPSSSLVHIEQTACFCSLCAVVDAHCSLVHHTLSKRSAQRRRAEHTSSRMGRTATL
jgi:hypothetical protein